MDNQKFIIDQLDDLKDGKLAIMEEIQRRAAKALLEQQFNTYEWLGPHGMTQIAASYDHVIARYRSSLDENFDSADQALLDAALIASKYWSDELLRV